MKLLNVVQHLFLTSCRLNLLCLTPSCTVPHASRHALVVLTLKMQYETLMGRSRIAAKEYKEKGRRASYDTAVPTERLSCSSHSDYHRVDCSKRHDEQADAQGGKKRSRRKNRARRPKGHGAVGRRRRCAVDS